MLETAQERVELLKTGISSKKIEELYIKHNNFKLVNASLLLDLSSVVPDSKPLTSIINLQG